MDAVICYFDSKRLKLLCVFVIGAVAIAYLSFSQVRKSRLVPLTVMNKPQPLEYHNKKNTTTSEADFTILSVTLDNCSHSMDTATTAGRTETTETTAAATTQKTGLKMSGKKTVWNSLFSYFHIN